MDELLGHWLSQVQARLLSWRHSQQVTVVYAEIGDALAQYRVRVRLANGSLLQCIERVRQLPDGLHGKRYSFHWQRADGGLICRWNNAPHHPEIASFPHHLHVGDQGRVQAHAAVDVFGVLEQIEAALAAPPA